MGFYRINWVQEIFSPLWKVNGFLTSKEPHPLWWNSDCVLRCESQVPNTKHKLHQTSGQKKYFHYWLLFESWGSVVLLHQRLWLLHLPASRPSNKTIVPGLLIDISRSILYINRKPQFVRTNIDELRLQNTFVGLCHVGSYSDKGLFCIECFCPLGTRLQTTAGYISYFLGEAPYSFSDRDYFEYRP